MPIPESPLTRQEQYLNAMATGDTSGIPDTPLAREEMYLDTIARNGSGGSGSGLPEVSAADNGDVLTVVEGAWAKAAPSGGANILVCYLSYDSEVGETHLAVLDGGFLTYNMIINSDAALIMLIEVQENGVCYYPLTQANYERDAETGDTTYYAHFGPPDYGEVAEATDPDNYLTIWD